MSQTATTSEIETISEATEQARKSLQNSHNDFKSSLEEMPKKLTKHIDDQKIDTMIMVAFPLLGAATQLAAIAMLILAREKSRQIINEIANQAESAISYIGKYISDLISSPIKIAKSVRSWHEVNKAVARISGSMSYNNLEVAIEWQGSAAKGYRETFEEQKKAAEVTSTLIGNLQDFLSNQLIRLVTLITELITKFTELYAEGAKMLASFLVALNPLEWGNILDKISGFLGKAMVSITEIINKIISYLFDGIESVKNMRKNTISAQGLPGGTGEWPMPYKTITAKPPAKSDGPKYPGWHQ